MSATLDLILDTKEFRLLDGLRLNPRKSFTGTVRGERFTKKKGISIEFADYRDYVEGDDLRHLDWNVLARLETPVLKTYRDEEDLAVHILIDTSTSMSFGEPSKFEAACHLGTALAYVALCSGDAVYPRALGDKSEPMAALRSRANFPRYTRWVRAHKPESSYGLSRAIKLFLSSQPRVGVAVLLSDGLDPEIGPAIKSLSSRGFEVLMLQILSDIEIDPDLEGDLRLLDSESDSKVEITVNSYALSEYKKRLSSHNSTLEEAVLRSGGRYALVRPDQSLEVILKNVFKRQGWVV